VTNEVLPEVELRLTVRVLDKLVELDATVEEVEECETVVVEEEEPPPPPLPFPS